MYYYSELTETEYYIIIKYFYIEHLLIQTVLFCLFISLLLSIVSEVPVQEDTLMRTIIIGLSNELPLTAPETLEIADSLVRRVAAIKTPSPWIQSSQSGEDVLKLSFELTNISVYALLNSSHVMGKSLIQPKKYSLWLGHVHVVTLKHRYTVDFCLAFVSLCRKICLCLQVRLIVVCKHLTECKTQLETLNSSLDPHHEFEMFGVK